MSMMNYINLPEQHLVVPQVNEVEFYHGHFPSNRRLLPAKNKLISKRETDRVNDSLASVVHKPNSVAVAVTRLQSGGVPAGGSHTGTPEEGDEGGVEKKSIFTDTSQLLKLTGTRTVSPSPTPHGRLHSIRN
jgi:hypothetical protein